MSKKSTFAPFYLLGCCLAFNSISSAYAEELFLEGVSILGSKKTASVVYNQQAMSLHKGDNIGEWIVDLIEERSIKLRDKDGKVQTLELHSSINDSPEEVAPASAPADLTDIKTGTGFQPRVIKDEDVPPGHRKVRTPFGDVLIKENADNPGADNSN